MKAFGLEIRKSNSLPSLYNDVDSILAAAGVRRGEVTEDIERQTVAHSLQNMMAPDKWLCICDIDKCIKVCGLFISQERYKIYSALHCVHWKNMEPSYRTLVMAMLLDDFREVLNSNNTQIVSV
jgi:hypothetical protein